MAKIFIMAFSSAVAALVFTVEQDFASNAPGIQGILTAVLMGVAAIIMAWAAMKTAAQKAIAPVKAQVDKIETSVNSRSTAYEGTISGLRQQVEMKDEVINDLRKMAAILASAKQASETIQAVSQAAVAGATGISRPHDPVVADKPVLQAIEKNTQETAMNTSKTDATVQELKDKA